MAFMLYAATLGLLFLFLEIFASVGIQSHGAPVPNTGAVLGSLELLVDIVVPSLPLEFCDFRVIRFHLAAQCTSAQCT